MLDALCIISLQPKNMQHKTSVNSDFPASWEEWPLYNI